MYLLCSRQSYKSFEHTSIIHLSEIPYKRETVITVTLLQTTLRL